MTLEAGHNILKTGCIRYLISSHQGMTLLVNILMLNLYDCELGKVSYYDTWVTNT